MYSLAATVVTTFLLGSASAQDVNVISPKNGPFMEIPFLGFGTWDVHKNKNASEIVASAIEAGYRHLDCATAYSNQKEVGLGIKEGLKRTGLQRKDLWITSKIWQNRHGDQAKVGLETNLKELGLDYIDMTLMHFPVGGNMLRPSYDTVQTWKEMEKLVSANHTPENGKTRFIGISNFNVSQIDELLAAATIKPKVHQFERHIYLQDNKFVDYHKSKNLTITAYAPLGNTNPMYSSRAGRPGAPPPLLENPVLKEIASARGCTTAQVALKWNMDQGVVVHPKTQRKERMKENFEAYTKCKLTAEDHLKIKDMEKTWNFRFWDICKTVMGLPCYVGLERND